MPASDGPHDRSHDAGEALDPERLLADQRWLLALARGLVGDEQAAEDVVQETRMRVWSHPPADATRGGGWLRRIARNVGLRMRERDAARDAREQLAARPERQPATDELVARVQMQRAVADAVLALGEPYRTAVLLRFFDDLPPRAIASRLGVPVETVRTRLKRALEQLRARLDGTFGARDSWALLLLPWIGTWPGAGVAAAVGAGAGAGAASAATTSATTSATGSATAGGVIAMKVSTKLGLAAAAAVVIGATAWQVAHPRPASVDAPASAPANATRDRRAADGSATPDTNAAASAAPTDRSAERAEEPALADASASHRLDHVTVRARIVDERTHAPLPGARLTIAYFLWPAPSDRPTASALADGEGRVAVEFGPADGGSFDWFVTHADHATLVGDARQLTATAGTRRAHEDLGEIALERGAAITGRVLRVPEQAPVADAQLFLARTFASWSGFTPNDARPVGQTRPDGTFELSERVASGREAHPLYAVTPTGVGWALVQVVKGREQIDGVEVPIEPAAQLDVRVVDEAGAPFRGAHVLAVPRFAPLGMPAHYPRDGSAPWIAGERTWRPLFTATTAADGGATFLHLPEGREDALLESWSGNMASYQLFALAEKCEMAVQRILLTRGAHESVKLVLRRQRPLVIRGRVVDEGGHPIADASVREERTEPAISDEAGLFELAPFTPDGDPFTLDVTAEGFGPLHAEFARSKLAAATTPRPDVVGTLAGEEITLELTLASARAVAGVCVDDHGQPIAGVSLRLSRHDEHTGEWSFRTPGDGATEADGRFVIADATAGDWELYVSAPEGFRDPPPRTLRGGDSDVVVKLGRLPPARARLVAEVVDAESGAPLDPLDAYVFPAFVRLGTGKAPTCSLGKIVADGLFVTRWRLGFKTAQGSRCHREFEVTDPDEEVHLRIEVGANASFDGRVVVDGQPELPKGERFFVFFTSAIGQSGSCGHAVDADGRRLGGVTDDCTTVASDGTFRMVDVTPDVPIRAWLADDALFGEATITLKPGEHGHLVLHAAPSGSIEWRLGEALPHGEFTMRASRDGGPFALITGSESVAVGAPIGKRAFAPGRIRWRIEYVSGEEAAPRPRVVEGEVDVVARETTVVEVKGFE